MSPKFPMHNMHYNQSLKQVLQAVAASITSAFLYYSLVHLPLKASYTNFYSTYDPIASFNRMRDAGYFDSCPVPNKDKK